MNENVIALAREAGCSMLYDYSAEGHAMVLNCNNLDKFAELLLNRCIDVIQNGYDNSGEEYELGLKFAEICIRNEFGLYNEN